MAYLELVNVALGVMGQIDACLSALDNHADPPIEVEQVCSKLEEAYQICEVITHKAEAETTTEEASTPEK